MGSGRKDATTPGSEPSAGKAAARILNRKTLVIAAPLVGIGMALLSRRVRGTAASRLDTVAAALGLGTKAQRRLPSAPAAPGKREGTDAPPTPAALGDPTATATPSAPASLTAQPKTTRRKQDARATNAAPRQAAAPSAADAKPRAARSKAAPPAAKPRAARRKPAPASTADGSLPH